MALVRWDEDALFRSTFQSDSDWSDLLFHYKCLTREELRKATFIEYVKQEMIPRGLRVLKEPQSFNDDSAFIAKWNAILNKCSLDLMLLIIETTNKKIAETNSIISELEEDMKLDFSSKTYKRCTKDLKAYIERYRSNVRRRKIKKFRRDERDYRIGNVYPWMTRETKGPSKQYWGFTSEESGSSCDDFSERQRFFGAGRSSSQTRRRSSSNRRARQFGENRWNCSWK